MTMTWLSISSLIAAMNIGNTYSQFMIAEFEKMRFTFPFVF